MSLLWVYYHGNVDIAYWEWALAAVYLIVLYTMFARQKNMNIKKHPEYKFYLWGLIAKVVGGVAFSLIYFYYYEGGDTIAYFYSAVSMSRLAEIDPSSYFTVLVRCQRLANLSVFNETIGYPYSVRVLRYAVLLPYPPHQPIGHADLPQLPAHHAGACKYFLRGCVALLPDVRQLLPIALDQACHRLPLYALGRFLGIGHHEGHHDPERCVLVVALLGRVRVQTTKAGVQPCRSWCEHVPADHDEAVHLHGPCFRCRSYGCYIRGSLAYAAPW